MNALICEIHYTQTFLQSTLNYTESKFSFLAVVNVLATTNVCFIVFVSVVY